MRCNGPRGVAPGWFVIAPFGATGNSATSKSVSEGRRANAVTDPSRASLTLGVRPGSKAKRWRVTNCGWLGSSWQSGARPGAASDRGRRPSVADASLPTLL